MLTVSWNGQHVEQLGVQLHPQETRVVHVTLGSTFLVVTTYPEKEAGRSPLWRDGRSSEQVYSDAQARWDNLPRGSFRKLLRPIGLLFTRDLQLSNARSFDLAMFAPQGVENRHVSN